MNLKKQHNRPERRVVPDVGSQMNGWKSFERIFLHLVLLSFLALMLAGPVWADDAVPEWLEASLIRLAPESSQVLVITGDESGFRAVLYPLQKRGNGWKTVFPPVRALLGEKGFAPPGQKREGDLRTPSGIFPLRRTFGYAPSVESRMPYRQVDRNDLWVDDPASPDYNRWVRRGETSAASFEVMRLEDDRYRYGIIVEYNTDPVIKGAGSAIFIHVRRGENMPTLGCVALSEEDILKLLAWLDPAGKPVSVMGTRAAIASFAPKRTPKHETSGNRLPKGFVYADEMIPDLRLDLRYAGSHNFVGSRIDGYLKPRCILSREAAEALKRAQEELRQFGLGLKIFDAYRPQTAVRHFVRWAGDVKDVKARPEFYPDVLKENLFKEGYIAEKSSHSRGSTVDLTIVSLAREGGEQELDMGSGFDFFGVSSWPDNPGIALPSRAHRMLLRAVMEKQGFKPYPQEWWHFTLKKEPWPDTYFDFPVQ